MPRRFFIGGRGVLRYPGRDVFVGGRGSGRARNQVRIEASADDGEFTGAGIATSSNSNNIGPFAFDTYAAILRFTNIRIPAGATVSTAFLRCVATLAVDTTTGTLSIQADEGGASQSFPSDGSDYNGRSWGTAETGNFGNLALGQTFDTFDVADIVQRMVDLGAWDDGDTILFRVTSDDVSMNIASWRSPQFDPPELHYTYTEGGGGPDYTLVAETGAFTLTGINTSLIVSRKLTITTGVFTLTGQNAGLLRTFVLTCTSGSFTLTGQNAGLLANRTITCSAGSYTLTGQNVTLSVSRVLVCGTGAYTYTGNNTSLTATRRLSCSTGSYLLSGEGVSLTVSRRLAIGTGEFSLTGNDTNLLVSRSILCSTGSYTLTGNDVTMSLLTFTAVVEVSAILKGPTNRIIGLQGPRSRTHQFNGPTSRYLTLQG